MNLTHFFRLVSNAVSLILRSKKVLIGLAIALCQLSSVAHSIESEPILEVEAVGSIAVEAVIADKKIQRRLTDIFKAVGSYEDIVVKVISGVVVLSGQVDEEHQIEWAHELASRLEGVVAVQNQISSRPKKLFDLTPAQTEIEGFHIGLMRRLPSILLAMTVLLVALICFTLASSALRRGLATKMSSELLLNATTRILSMPVLLVGIYFALRISGLTGLAFTLLGGTSLLGLALGFGLKNSFEDYSASIFLSLKKPFTPSDWVKIGEHEGIVQSVTSRSTIIIDFSGNHILIPNSLVYRSVIINMTANPKLRSDFCFGLDYGDRIEAAQSLVLEFLTQNQFVLKDPEPLVLIDNLADSAVQLRAYFWINAREVSLFKVKSHLLLEVKNLLLAKGYRFPDPFREIVFANPLSIVSEGSLQTNNKLSQASVEKISAVSSQSSTKQEIAKELEKSGAQRVKADEVRAEVFDLNKQSRESDLPDQGESVI